MSKLFEEIVGQFMSNPRSADIGTIDKADRETMVSGLTKLIADPERFRAHLKSLDEELVSRAEDGRLFTDLEEPERLIANGLTIADNRRLVEIATNWLALCQLRLELLDASEIHGSWIAAIAARHERDPNANRLRRTRNRLLKSQSK